MLCFACLVCWSQPMPKHRYRFLEGARYVRSVLSSTSSDQDISLYRLKAGYMDIYRPAMVELMADGLIPEAEMCDVPSIANDGTTRAHMYFASEEPTKHDLQRVELDSCDDGTTLVTLYTKVGGVQNFLMRLRF